MLHIVLNLGKEVLSYFVFIVQKLYLGKEVLWYFAFTLLKLHPEKEVSSYFASIVLKDKKSCLILYLLFGIAPTLENKSCLILRLSFEAALGKRSLAKQLDSKVKSLTWASAILSTWVLNSSWMLAKLVCSCISNSYIYNSYFLLFRKG